MALTDPHCGPAGVRRARCASLVTTSRSTPPTGSARLPSVDCESSPLMLERNLEYEHLSTSAANTPDSMALLNL